MENKYQDFLRQFRARLPIGESFDVLERAFNVAGRQGKMYFVDGLTDGSKVQLLLNFLLSDSNLDMPRRGPEGFENAEEFIATCYPFLDVQVTDDFEQVLKQLLSGLVPFILDGLDKILVADARDYPARSVEEPDKEKTLRGAKDGFTETFMDNIGLVRRRIRDPKLIFKSFVVGKKSKTDVALVYMKGVAENELVKRISDRLDNLDVDALTVADQSLIEKLLAADNPSGVGSGASKSDANGSTSKSDASGAGDDANASKNAANEGAQNNDGADRYSSFKTKPPRVLGRFNPFPRVRYTQRPDIVCAHLTEGKIALIIDNSPTVLLLPVELFDFFQDVDDYYFPIITGNYFRLLRGLNGLVILFVSSIYLLMSDGYMSPPNGMEFIVPDENFAIPIFWQFILLELAIDGLKLASLNTPESLGMSLSVIGALILGQFSVDSGWFIPQTILVMAVIALASFTQPSIELSYAVKFMRIISLVFCFILGPWGLAAAIALMVLIVATTKTISGHSYLYPLLPFDWKVLKKLLFRTTC